MKLNRISEVPMIDLCFFLLNLSSVHCSSQNQWPPERPHNNNICWIIKISAAHCRSLGKSSACVCGGALWPLWDHGGCGVAEIHIGQIQDGGLRPKWWNHHNSVVNWPIVLKFGRLVHCGSTAI